MWACFSFILGRRVAGILDNLKSDNYSLFIGIVLEIQIAYNKGINLW